MKYEYKHIENLFCPESKLNEWAKDGWKLKGGLHLIEKNATGDGFYHCNVYSCTLERRVKSFNVPDVIDSSIPKPPKPPLFRVLREGAGHLCANCGSTTSKVGFLGLFGKRLCDNKKCSNSNDNLI
jgi:hypothetical protein